MSDKEKQKCLFKSILYTATRYGKTRKIGGKKYREVRLVLDEDCIEDLERWAKGGE